jgi:hypothetical protein
MTRTWILFVHIVGVLALFSGMALEWLSLDAARRSTSRADAVRWVRVNASVLRMSGIAFAIVVASGFFLGGRFGVLGHVWLRATYLALLVMGIVGGPVTRRRMRALQQAAKDPHDTNVTVLQIAASHPILRLSVSVRVVFGLAVVYLMIGKPDVVESVLALSAATILAATMAVARRPVASRWRDPGREGGPSPAAGSAD